MFFITQYKCFKLYLFIFNAYFSEGKRKLVKPHFISDEEYIKTWKAQKYEGLPFKENSPEYYTKRGLRVRSKSEILIADMLDEMSIPFFYEKPLQLKRRIRANRLKKKSNCQAAEFCWLKTCRLMLK